MVELDKELFTSIPILEDEVCKLDKKLRRLEHFKQLDDKDDDPMSTVLVDLYTLHKDHGFDLTSFMYAITKLADPTVKSETYTRYNNITIKKLKVLRELLTDILDTLKEARDAHE